MDKTTLWREYAALPPEARQEVDALIATLIARYSSALEGTPFETGPLADEPFVGMWRDREDLADSRAWVRSTREREWTRFDG